jgi:hypothetical protein
MSVRTARSWEHGPLPSETRQSRSWRTRRDPFVEVWASEVEPLLVRDREGVLEATFLFEELARRHPGRFTPGQVRTLQRRVREWRACQGPPREVFFPQVHPLGREAQLDFTHASELGVTIAGEPLDHLLFELVLCASGWRFAQVAFGETFEALVEGLQNALWTLGGVPEVARTDNLSAATHELRQSGGRVLTERFAAVLAHYGLRSTRIHPGASHENGVVEQAHERLKSMLAQALVVRGSRDFETLAAYQAFIDGVVARLNERRAERIGEERPHLRPLPPARLPSYTVTRAVVRRWSTIRVANRTYSVPSRLVGHEVEARRHADVVEIFFAGRCLETMPRLRGEQDHRIDYRHVIWSLVRSPAHRGRPRRLLHARLSPRPGAARRQARPRAPACAAQARSVRGPDPRRPRLRTAGPRRSRGALHAARRALRASLPRHHEQPRLQPVGPDLPQPDGHRRRHRPHRAPLGDPRVRRRELSHRGRQAAHPAGPGRVGRCAADVPTGGTGRDEEPRRSIDRPRAGEEGQSREEEAEIVVAERQK